MPGTVRALGALGSCEGAEWGGASTGGDVPSLMPRPPSSCGRNTTRAGTAPSGRTSHVGRRRRTSTRCGSPTPAAGWPPSTTRCAATTASWAPTMTSTRSPTPTSTTASPPPSSSSPSMVSQVGPPPRSCPWGWGSRHPLSLPRDEEVWGPAGEPGGAPGVGEPHGGPGGTAPASGP